MPLPGKGFTLSASGWLLITWISVFYSINTGEAVYLAGLRTLMVLAMVWLASQPELKMAIYGILIWGIVEAHVGAGELLGWIDMGTRADPPCGLTGNPNLFGGLMMLLCPFPLLLLKKGKVVQNISFFSASAVMATMGCLSGSQAAQLALGVMAGMAILLMGLKKSRGAIQMGLKFLSVAAVVLIMTAPLIWAFAFVKTTTHPLTRAGERAMVWKATARLTAESPIQGMGLAGWKYRILEKGLTGNTREFGNAYFAEPHNDYLWVYAESGLPAILGYGTLLVVLFLRGLRRLAIQPEDKKSPMLIFPLLSLTGWLVLSGFTSPLERVDFLAALAFAGGIILAEKEGGKKVWLISKWWMGVPVILSCFLAVVAMNRWQGEKGLVEMHQARKKAQWPEVEKLSVAAGNRWFTSDYFSSTPLVWYRGIAMFNEGRNEDALVAFREARRQSPFHPHVLQNLASAYVMNGENDSAIYYYRLTISTFPEFDEPRINLSRVLDALGDREGATDVLKSFPGLQPDRKAKIEEALKMMEQ
jgi:O-antigen ligase